MNAPLNPSRLDADQPWPGLSSFHEQDASYFRGRAREIDAVLTLVRREALTVLFGRAGLGKTSLLRAGLFPTLRAELCLPVYVRLDYDRGSAPLTLQIVEHVESAVRAAGMTFHPRSDTLWEAFHRIGGELWDDRNRPVTPVIVIDQFEEIFTKGQDRGADVAELVEQIADLVERRIPDAVRAKLEAGDVDPSAFDFERQGARVVFSLREDFMPQLESLRPRLRVILDKRYRLEPMSGVAANDVLDAGRHLLDDGVAAKIVRFVAGEQDQNRPLSDLVVEPALLSVFANELNDRRCAASEPRITSDLLTGSQKKILTDFYERSVGDLPASVRCFLEESLLTRAGYRDSVEVGRAYEFAEVSPAVIATLVDRRIVRIERTGRISRVELTHDLLTDVIRQSRDARHEKEAASERVAAEAALAKTKRELRRTRLVAAFACAVVLIMGLLVFMVVRQGEAIRKTQQAVDLESRRKDAAEKRVLDTERKNAADNQRAREERTRIQQQEASRQGKLSAVNRLNADAAADALASLASTLRVDPDNAWARRLTFNLLLTRGWPRAEKVVQFDESVRALAVSAEGRRLIVAGRKTVKIFETATRTVVCERTFDNFIFSAAISPDGKRFAVSDNTNSIFFGEVSKCRAQKFENAHEDIVTRLVFSPDGNLLASGDDSGAVRLWDFAQRVPYLHPLEMSGPISGIEFGPKGTLLAACTGLGESASTRPSEAVPSTVSIWKISDLTQVGNTIGAHDAIGSIAFNADESRLALASRDGMLLTWDVATGKLFGLPRMAAEARGTPWSLKTQAVEFDRSGERLLTSASDGARLWPATKETDLFPAAAIRLALPATAHFNDDTTRVVTASDDGVVRVWDAAAQPLMEPARSLSEATDARFVRGTASIAAGYADGRLVFWRIDRAGDAELLSQAPPRSFIIGRDGKTAYALAANGRLTIADLATTKKVRSVWVNSRYCETLLDASPDGAFVRCRSSGAALPNEWIVRTDIDSNYDEPLSTWRHHADDVDGTLAAATLKAWRSEGGDVRFSPNPDFVLVETGDDLVIRDRTRNWEIARRLKGAGPIAGFDGQGKRMLTVYGKQMGEGIRSIRDVTLRVWDLSTGQPIRSIKAEVDYKELDPAGTRLLYGSDDAAFIVDLETGAKIRLRHGAVQFATFSGDGAYVVTTSTDRTARVWRAANGAPVGIPLAHGARVIDAVFSADGQLLATVEGAGEYEFDAGIVRIWDVQTGLLLRRAAPARIGEQRPVFPSMPPKPAFTADGRLLVFDDAILKALDFRAGTKEDAALLADLAEAVGGRRVAEGGVIVDAPAGITTLRAVAAKAVGDSDSAKLARWFGADPRKRSASPFTSQR